VTLAIFYNVDIGIMISIPMSIAICTTRKRGNCECIATWDRPSHVSPLLLSLRRHAKFEVAAAEPIHCLIIAFLPLIHYFTPWSWPLTLNICSV